jgi:hypothetical protein
MPVLFRAEMAGGIHGLPAERTDGPPTVDYFVAPGRQDASLLPAAPESDNRGIFRVSTFRQYLAGKDDDQVTLSVITQPHFTATEKRVNRRINAHLFFLILCRGHKPTGILAGNFTQHLLYTRGQRLKLHFFNDDRYRLDISLAPALKIKNTLSGLADCIGSNVLDGVKIYLKTRHEYSFF